MKKLLLSLIITLAVSQIIFTQARYDGSIFDIHQVSEIDKIPRSISTDKNLLIPESFINFDDIIFTADNSIQISPNRYNGVSFYSFYSNTPTWLTHFDSYSYPNSLIVGVCCGINGEIISVESLTIDFAQNSKDVSFWWGTSGWYNTGIIEVYEGANNQLVASTQVNLNFYWNQFTVNASQKIRRIILRRPNGNYPTGNGHISLDNFQFFPGLPTTNSPVGYLDSVQTSDPVGAVGWSVDPDNTSASNTVHCYVNGPAGGGGIFLGAVTANLPSPGVPHPGNHRFLMPIPANFRNNLTHQMYCYGIDITGGDSPTLLTGSPKPFRFITETIGWIDTVSSLTESTNAVAISDGEVVGWSLDTDLPGNSNPVHFYIDGPAGTGIYIDQTLANIPRPDVNTITGYPGDHGFSYFIPDQYRDGLTHTIYAYGIDITGGPPKLLQGSPKTFNLNTRVSTLTFEPISTATIRSVIDTNPNTGGGQRIFPDKDDPSTTIDPYAHATVQVKALITPVKQGIRVYFKSYDLDDPSANMLPLDDDTGTITGNDNRGTPKSGTFKATSALTDANGIATVNFTTTMQPGDNFAVAASTNTTYLGTIKIDGTNLKDNANTQIPATLACSSSAVNACRTDMLTVWRKIHMEVDSMGIVENTHVTGVVTTPVTVEKDSLGPVTVAGLPNLDAGRFRGGRIIFSTGQNYKLVDYSNDGSGILYINNQGGRGAFMPTGTTYDIWDDDDFNFNDGISLHGDNGEDVIENTDIFKVFQPVDGNNANDTPKNVYAAAYIRPEYEWAKTAGTNSSSLNNSNVSFLLNVEFYSQTDAMNLILENNRGSKMKESDAFWVAYILIAYQGARLRDCDVIGADCDGGIGLSYVSDTVTNSTQVLEGGKANFVFIESIADGKRTNIPPAERLWYTAVSHEVGHQFGIKGDGFGSSWLIMGYDDETIDYLFHPEHLNLMRWRIHSPGESQ